MLGFVIYSGMLIILCVGFSMTYLMEKFPNFAHTSYASIGTIISYTIVRLLGYNPYLSAPISSIVGGLLGIVLYLLIVKPLQEKGRGGIELIFAMFALSIILSAIMSVFSYWVLITYRFRTSGFILVEYDFSIFGYPGIFFVAPLLSVILVVSLHLFLTRTNFGIAIRATAEDPKLAASLGINLFHVHLSSWFITGTMASLAGSLLPLWLPTSLGWSDALLVSVLAGSVVGGLDNIYGAVIGGILVSVAQKMVPSLLVGLLGTWIAGYEHLAPILIIVIVLMVEPRGLIEVLNEEHSRLWKVWRRLSYRRSKLRS
ncbi:branched-chain amino acid ABC transporter permease [Candidatus Bathyarchaeota archaeon]|nr:branched-chain amino acid ABC transporter permease [Candidatus Bathyarchaeota archaeon]